MIAALSYGDGSGAAAVGAGGRLRRRGALLVGRGGSSPVRGQGKIETQLPSRMADQAGRQPIRSVMTRPLQ